MNTKFMMIALGALSIAASPLAAKVSAGTTRYADFKKIFMESEYGKQEQARFQEMQAQMEKSVKDLSEQLKDVQAKLSDEDVLDGMSKKAEEELREKQATLTAELQRYQMQFQQIVQQAQAQSFYMVKDQASKASDLVRKEKKIKDIQTNEYALSYEAELDVTDLIIEKMNKQFAEESAEAKAKAELEEKK